MQQFINVMDGYIVNQVLHVSWLEFQKSLQDNVRLLTCDSVWYHRIRYLAWMTCEIDTLSS